MRNVYVTSLIFSPMACDHTSWDKTRCLWQDSTITPLHQKWFSVNFTGVYLEEMQNMIWKTEQWYYILSVTTISGKMDAGASWWPYMLLRLQGTGSMGGWSSGMDTPLSRNAHSMSMLFCSCSYWMVSGSWRLGTCKIKLNIHRMLKSSTLTVSNGLLNLQHQHYGTALHLYCEGNEYE